VWADTVTLADHALTYNPSSFPSHDMLSYVARQHRDWQTAELHLRKSLDIRPDDQFSNANLGTLLLDTGRPGEAIAYLKRAIAVGDIENEVLYPLGVSYLKIGRDAEAADVLASAVQRKPDDVSSLAALGYALASQNKFAEAEAVLRKALAINPTHQLAAMGLQKVLAAQGKAPAAPN